MCVLSTYVNYQLRYCFGQSPKPNRALQAFVAARLLRERALGIDTIIAAARCTGSSRSLVKAALVILQSENPNLVMDILVGRRTLLEAAKKLRNRAKLIETFRTATAEDRIAFGSVVGAGTLWESAIAPSL